MCVYIVPAHSTVRHHKSRGYSSCCVLVLTPPALDPEAAYSSLDSNERPQREAGEGREHYVDVG